MYYFQFLTLTALPLVLHSNILRSNVYILPIKRAVVTTHFLLISNIVRHFADLLSLNSNRPIQTLRFLMLSFYWWTAVRLPVAPPLSVNHCAAGAPITVDTLLWTTTRLLHAAAFLGLFPFKWYLTVGKTRQTSHRLCSSPPPLSLTVSSQALLQHEV